MKPAQVINLGIKIIKAKFLNGHLPFKVTHYITYRCNLKCPFCNRVTLEALEMDTFQIKKMMKEFRDMGTSFWVFNGGEPLLREDLPELIDYAKGLDFHCSLVTNGVLLAKKLEEHPAFSKPDFVQISLQGPKEIHDKMCGEGAYNRIIEALDILKKIKIRTNILTLITQDNIDYFSHLIELVGQYRMTVAFQPLIFKPDNNSQLRRQHFPSQGKFKEATERLLEQKKAGAPILSSIKYLEMIRDSWSGSPGRIPCYAAQMYCSVTPDGYVVSCCAKLDRTESKSFGPAVGFKKAFDQLDEMSGCRDCRYFGPQELNLILGASPINMFRAPYRGILSRRKI